MTDDAKRAELLAELDRLPENCPVYPLPEQLAIRPGGGEYRKPRLTRRLIDSDFRERKR